MSTFSDLGLAEPILRALETEGYTHPTPIQRQAIPPLLEGRDLLGIAQTGTGKTAAFALPILDRLAADRRPPARRGCRVLVLSPTRELATQIGDSFRAYGRNLGLKVAVVFGGVAHRPQIEATRDGVDVLVATPGRLLDHIGERNLDISTTEILVLDEADQMLDLGFVKPIQRIVGFLPERRQNLFFSATMPGEIGRLADQLLTDPVKVQVTPVASTVDRVSQRVIHVPASMKRKVLVDLLADENMSRTLVFTRTKRGADRVARHLEAAEISAAAIHGNKSQRQREAALLSFRNGETRVLVATDIAARGIDIDNVTHVINYELPDVPEAYVHRIGRTARAGAEGDAISLCDGEERTQLRDIERLTRQTIPSETRGAGNGLAAVLGSDETPEHDREPRRGERRQAGGGRSAQGARRHEERRGEGRGHGERRPRRDGDNQERGRTTHAGEQRDEGQATHERREPRVRDRRPERDEPREGVREHRRPEAREARAARPSRDRQSHRQAGEDRRAAPRAEHRGGEDRPERAFRGRDRAAGRSDDRRRDEQTERPRETQRQARGERTFSDVYGNWRGDRAGRGTDSETWPLNGETFQPGTRRGRPEGERTREGQRPHRDERRGGSHAQGQGKGRGDGEARGERGRGGRGQGRGGPARGETRQGPGPNRARGGDRSARESGRRERPY